MTRVRLFTILSLVMLLVIGTLVGCGRERSESVVEEKTGKVSPPFYEGKTLTIIVSTKPGGGFDTYARLIAPFLEKYLPGSTVIVKNVPGAGHIVGANEVWLSKPDGLTIGLSNIAGLIASQIVGREGVKYDLTKFTWLARIAGEERVLVVGSKTNYQTIQDIISSNKELIIGTSGVGSGPYNTSLMLSRALGFKAKLVPGYGGAEEQLAIQRGEIEAALGTLEDWNRAITNGDVRPVLLISTQRNKNLPNVPILSELVDTPDGKALASYILAETEVMRSLYAPPDLPDEIKSILRNALDKALTDPELVQQAGKMGLNIQPMGGDEVQKMVKDAIEQPPEIVALLKDIISKSGSE